MKYKVLNILTCLKCGSFAAEEGGCLNVVQMRIYAVIPGELAVLGDLGRDDEDLTWCLCTSAGGGMRS